MKRIILLTIGFILSIYLFGCSAKTASNQQQNIRDYKNYKNNEYKISLNYNKDWKLNKLYSHRYEGKDGFFDFDAMGGENLSIDEVANNVATHKLYPFGTNPQISKLTIQGQEARLVMPSDDQPKENNNLAELIIKYPEKVVIEGNSYFYFVLYADKNNIEKIAKTIKFISQASLTPANEWASNISIQYETLYSNVFCFSESKSVSNDAILLSNNKKYQEFKEKYFRDVSITSPNKEKAVIYIQIPSPDSGVTMYSVKSINVNNDTLIVNLEKSGFRMVEPAIIGTCKDFLFIEVDKHNLKDNMKIQVNK